MRAKEGKRSTVGLDTMSVDMALGSANGVGLATGAGAVLLRWGGATTSARALEVVPVGRDTPAGLGLDVALLPAAAGVLGLGRDGVANGAVRAGAICFADLCLG